MTQDRCLSLSLWSGLHCFAGRKKRQVRFLSFGPTWSKVLEVFACDWHDLSRSFNLGPLHFSLNRALAEQSQLCGRLVVGRARQGWRVAAVFVCPAAELPWILPAAPVLQVFLLVSPGSGPGPSKVSTLLP
jgi:hypothetical protein